MSMGPLVTAAAALAGINVVLLVPLVAVWVRNHSTFGTGLVAGLLTCALAMLAENAVAVYFFFSMQGFYAGDPHVRQAVLVLRALRFVAIAVLSYVTVR